MSNAASESDVPKTLELKSIRTKSGTTVVVPSPGALCVVGGNNVGKSQLLMDIRRLLSGHKSSAVVLDSVDHKFHLSADNAEQWFRKNSQITSADLQPDQFAPLRGGTQLSMAHLLNYSSSPEPAELRVILDWFYRDLNAGERSGIATASGGMPSMMSPGGSSMMMMFRNGDLEKQLSDLCLRTFGFGLTLDRINGNIRLRVGKSDVPSPPLQHPTKEYADSVAALPLLETQGDGVKNYLGMVLHLITSSEAITVIDEPEAFLHPAQARSLGRYLGNTTQLNNRQLLTATHDRDFLLGLLESNAQVAVLRINRTGELTSAASLTAEDVRAIWERPTLRYSNVLQGLFHRVVVVCEADADCRWYSAVLDNLTLGAGIPADEVLFVPAGGKTGVQHCVAALEAIEVDCFAVLDFDVLLDIDQLKILLGKVHLRKDVDSEIIARVSAISRALNTKEMREKAKSGGLRGLPPGDLTKFATEAVSLLRQKRILVVSVGEMECFDRSISGKGAVWVTQALDSGLHKQCPEADSLLQPVIDVFAPSSNPPTSSE